MAALPYMPLYVADYLADAAHLSTLEHGAYLLLIMTYWQRGEALPDDDRKLARIARVSPDEWHEIRDTLAEFFDVSEGLWTQGRVQRELESVHTKSEKARNAGKASAQRRFNGRSTDVQQTLNHTDTDTDTDTDKGREERLEAPAKANAPKKLTPDDLKRAMSAKRGARLPPDWKPTADHRQMAEQEGFSPSLFNREADSFRDYWLSASGATATKLDWDAAFRNWLRKASEKLGPPNHRKGKTNGSIQDAARDLDEWAAAQESELRARLGGGPDAHDARMLSAK